VIPGWETPEEAMAYFIKHSPCFPYIPDAGGRMIILGRLRCDGCGEPVSNIHGETWATSDDAGNLRICFEGLTYCSSCHTFVAHRGIMRPEKSELSIQGVYADKWHDTAFVWVRNRLQELALRVVFWLWGKKCLSFLSKGESRP